MPRPVRAPGVQPLRKLAPQRLSTPYPDETNLECNKSEKHQHEWQISGDWHWHILPSIFCGRVLADEKPASLTKLRTFNQKLERRQKNYPANQQAHKTNFQNIDAETWSY